MVVHGIGGYHKTVPSFGFLSDLMKSVSYLLGFLRKFGVSVIWFSTGARRGLAPKAPVDFLVYKH